jgi:hypothetical protein
MKSEPGVSLEQGEGLMVAGRVGLAKLRKHPMTSGEGC